MQTLRCSVAYHFKNRLEPNPVHGTQVPHSAYDDDDDDDFYDASNDVMGQQSNSKQPLLPLYQLRFQRLKSKMASAVDSLEVLNVLLNEASATPERLNEVINQYEMLNDVIENLTMRLKICSLDDNVLRTANSSIKKPVVSKIMLPGEGLIKQNAYKRLAKKRGRHATGLKMEDLSRDDYAQLELEILHDNADEAQHTNPAHDNNPATDTSSSSSADSNCENDDSEVPTSVPLQYHIFELQGETIPPDVVESSQAFPSIYLHQTLPLFKLMQEFFSKHVHVSNAERLHCMKAVGSVTWRTLRRVRLTAANTKTICNMMEKTDPTKFLRHVLHNTAEFFSDSTEYGKAHEKDAIDGIATHLGMDPNVNSVISKGSAYYIHAVYNFLSATPDDVLD